MLHGIVAILTAVSPEGDTLKGMDTLFVNAPRMVFSSVGRTQRRWDDISTSPRSATTFLAENGVFLKQYGVSGVATISRRGAEPQQTQVLWNGLPVSSAMLGLTDLNTVFLFGNTEMILSDGGNASVYGSGAVGGTLQFIQGKPLKHGFHVSGIANGGSFNQRGAAADIGYTGKKSWIRAQSFFAASENNFSYMDARKYVWEKVKMQHAQTRFLTQRLQGGFQYKVWDFKAVTEYGQAERNLGLVLGSLVPQGIQNDWDIRSVLEAKAGWKKCRTVNRIGITRDKIVFNDTAKNENDTSLAITKHAQSEWYFQLGESRLLAGADLQWQQGNVSAYHGIKRRFYIGQFLSLIVPVKKWIINPGVRFEWYEKIPVWSLSAERKMTEKMTFKSNVHRTFRRPTLNDLFWESNYSDSLRSEYGYGAEAGFNYTHQRNYWKVNLSGVFYYRQVNSPIIWAPEGGVWRARNLYRGDYSGAQLSAGIQYKRHHNTYRFFGNYDYVNPQMIYYKGENSMQRIFVPASAGNAGIFAGYKSWSALVNSVFTGSRFTTSDNTSFLPAYVQLHLMVGYLLATKKWETMIQFEAKNVTNTSYQNIPGRPMPGRSFQLTIKITNK